MEHAVKAVSMFEAVTQRNQKQQKRQLQRGPCCILEIRRAELWEQPNNKFDWGSPLGWLATGRPDLRVNWTHGPTSGKTQVEYDTYQATWMSSLKVPYKPEEGFVFTVVDSDTSLFSYNDVIGRCFLSPAQAREALRTNEPVVMSLGGRCACPPAPTAPAHSGSPDRRSCVLLSVAAQKCVLSATPAQYRQARSKGVGVYSKTAL